jgi:hypothetical protein
VNHRLAEAGKRGLSEDLLDATFDLTAAVTAGIAQSMNQRYKRLGENGPGKI